VGTLYHGTSKQYLVVSVLQNTHIVAQKFKTGKVFLCAAHSAPLIPYLKKGGCGRGRLKREWSPTAGGRALRQTRAEKTDDHITLPLATIKTPARTRFPGMYDLPVTKHMEQSFGNALVANCMFGNVSWQCSLFKLCQSSSKCDNAIRRSCQGIRLSVAFGDFGKESNTGEI